MPGHITVFIHRLQSDNGWFVPKAKLNSLSAFFFLIFISNHLSPGGIY